MACSTYNNLNLSHKIRYSLASSLFISKSSHALPSTFTTPFPSPSHTPIKFNKSVKFSTRSVSVSHSNTYTFTWDDVVRISQPDSVPHDSSDLSGFFQKVKICNRGS
ncbi:nudix hydrolase 24, partial [Quercus suber]